MTRPIVSIHIDIARFVMEVSDLSMDSMDSTENLNKKLADWLRSFTRCLARRDPSLHTYGAYLLTETEEYRRADSERKKAKYSADSVERHGIPRKAADSAESPPQTDQTDQNRTDLKKEEKGLEFSRPAPSLPPKPKKIFAEDSIEIQAALFFWSYLEEWSPTAKEPTASGYQTWARDLSAMFRLDPGRTPIAYNELLDWIDTRKESRDGFSWRKNIHSPATLRQRWNEGKFDFLPSELAKDELQ